MAKREAVVIGVPVPGPTQYVTRTVHEQRAPTDASVALLAEFEKAARDKIENAVSVEGNGFNCVVHVMQEPISDQVVARAIFTLNGKQHTAEARVRAREARDADPKVELIGNLREAMASVIALEVLRPAFSNLKL